MTLAAPPTLAPDFTLPAHTGAEVTLSHALGPLGCVLVFFRGHWCPYCRRYLAKLQPNAAKFASRGATLLAVSPEPPATSAALARDLNLTFPLLSDTDGTVIAGYGVRNGFTAATSLLPHPAVFVLGADRGIHFKSVDRNYKRRTPMPAIHRALEELATGNAGLLPATGG